MAWIEVDDVVALMCTVPSEDVAMELGRVLVEEGLAACVNTVPGLRSIYRWKGEVCNDAEWLLVIKTVKARLPSLARRVEQLHPYETPELIALPVEGGLQAYVAWVREQTSAIPKPQPDGHV